MKHTEGRLRNNRYGELESEARLDGAPRFRVSLSGTTTAPAEEEIASLGRLADCWNAMQGIPNPFALVIAAEALLAAYKAAPDGAMRDTLTNGLFFDLEAALGLAATRPDPNETITINPEVL